MYLLINWYYRTLNEKKDELTRIKVKLEDQNRKLELSKLEIDKISEIASTEIQETLRMFSKFLNQIELKYGKSLDDKVIQYIGLARDGAKRMKRIVLYLLEFSKAGRPEDSKMDVNLNLLIEDIQLGLRVLIREKSAKIETEGLPVLRIWKSEISRVMTYLISNTIMYHKPDHSPIVKVSAQLKKNFWIVNVQDYGIGIDSNNIPILFKMSRRFEENLTEDHIGMGLTICHKKVEHWGGEISVQSQKGVGATFTFTIPR